MKKILKLLLCLMIVSIFVSIFSTILSRDKEPVPHSGNPASSITLSVPTIAEEVYPAFTDLISLRDFLNDQKAAGNYEVTFLYSNEDELTAEGVTAKMTGSMSVHYSYLDNRYTLTMCKYPGEKIVEAYFSGDTSQLTEDELETLVIAEEIVNYGMEQAADPLELEQFLHDVITEKVTYYTDDRMNDFEYDNAPRYLSVVGALLDGQANCQGYTDAFYTLASMAGFQVSKMSVETPDGGHQVNTIYLNNQWYVVDVTYDDNETYGTDYGRFNIGMDLITDYVWEEIYERTPISETTDPALFYYYRNNLAFETVEDFSRMIVTNWLEYGQMTFFGMVKNELNGDALTDALSAALNETGMGYSYEYSYSCNNRDCFYTVVFNE